MEKLYLDLLPINGIPDAFACSSKEIIALTGANIGNLAFRHALRNVVDGFGSYRPVLYGEALAKGKARQITDVLVSCANWLGTSANDEAANRNRVRAFEAIEAPVTCFGLGVQSKLDSGLPKLGPNTLRLAKVLSERGQALSVRDQKTQDTLESEGIFNTVVTGCPSNFLNPDPTLGAQVADRASASAASGRGFDDVRIAISEVSGGHPVSGRIIADHLLLMRDGPAFYIIQSPEMLPFTLRETEEAPRSYVMNSTFADKTEVARVLKAKTLYFSSMDAWLDFARTCELSFGMRIHGTIVPLQAGVPSLLIGHDSRTFGLAEQMGIPHMAPEVYLESRKAGPVRFFTAIAEVMKNYDARRAYLGGVMVDYLTVNGLTPHPSLTRLAASGATPPPEYAS